MNEEDNFNWVLNVSDGTEAENTDVSTIEDPYGTLSVDSSGALPLGELNAIQHNPYSFGDDNYSFTIGAPVSPGIYFYVKGEKRSQFDKFAIRADKTENGVKGGIVFSRKLTDTAFSDKNTLVPFAIGSKYEKFHLVSKNSNKYLLTILDVEILSMQISTSGNSIQEEYIANFKTAKTDENAKDFYNSLSVLGEKQNEETD